MKKLRLCFILTFFAAVFVIPVMAAGNDWGIYYDETVKRVIANETADYLAQFDSWYIGCEEEKVVYLTFDAGYENSFTAPILDILKKHEAPAAFFLVGTYIRDNPELVKRMTAEGHIVGNHTMSHPNMTKLDMAAFKKELAQVEDIYRSVMGEEISRYYRPPSGTYSEANLKMAQELGYKTMFWSLAYKDWDNNNQPTREQAFKKLLPRIHPGAVILLHNTAKINSLILDELLTKYKEMGYRFESLDYLAGKV